MRIAFVADSTLGLPPEEALAQGIHLVPQQVVLEGRSLRDYLDIKRRSSTTFFRARGFPQARWPQTTFTLLTKGSFAATTGSFPSTYRAGFPELFPRWKAWPGPLAKGSWSWTPGA